MGAKDFSVLLTAPAGSDSYLIDTWGYLPRAKAAGKGISPQATI